VAIVPTKRDSRHGTTLVGTKEEPMGVSEGDPSRIVIPGGKEGDGCQGECMLRNLRPTV